MPSPPFAKINAATSGQNSLVAGVSGQNIRVHSYTLMGAGQVDAAFTSYGASATVTLTGPFPLAAQCGASPAHAVPGLFETEPGDTLGLSLSGNVQVSGHLYYTLRATP